MILKGCPFLVVASQGFEPQYAESDSAVLPLNDEATSEWRVAFALPGSPRGVGRAPATKTSYEVGVGWVNAAGSGSGGGMDAVGNGGAGMLELGLCSESKSLLIKSLRFRYDLGIDCIPVSAFAGRTTGQRVG
jgi:hypothetical protein